MAKQSGPLKISGTLDDLSFYDSVYGPIVRRKGGPSKEQIAKKASCAPIRQSNSEFEGCAHAGKLLRQHLRPMLTAGKDHRLVWRVTQMMMALKDQDTGSARGKRSVSKGLHSETGRQLLKGFDFNSQALLREILLKPYLLDSTNGTFVIKGLVPARDLKWPQGATEASFQLGLLAFDPEQGKAELKQSSVLILPLSRKSSKVVLTPAGGPKKSGLHLYLLQIVFTREGHALPGENKPSRNCLGVVEVVG